MSLPVVATPIIPITIPYDDGELKLCVKQFRIGEYKVFAESYNTNSTLIFMASMANILNNCVVEPENFDIRNYPSYVVDYLYYQIYTLSVSGSLDLRLECHHEIEKKVIETDETTGEEQEVIKLLPCDTGFTYSINSSEVEITERKDNKIVISDNLVIKMKYPNWSVWHDVAEEFKMTMESLTNKENSEKTKDELEQDRLQLASIISKCVKEIWINDELWEEEYTNEEFADWLDTFPPEPYQKILSFIDETPQLYYEDKIKCPNCGHESTLRLLGLDAFLK